MSVCLCVFFTLSMRVQAAWFSNKLSTHIVVESRTDVAGIKDHTFHMFVLGFRGILRKSVCTYIKLQTEKTTYSNMYRLKNHNDGNFDI